MSNRRQETLGVERRHTTCAGCSYRLAIHPIGNVTRREHTRHTRPRRSRLNAQVPIVVHRELPLEQLCHRGMPDRHEEGAGSQYVEVPRFYVLDSHAGYPILDNVQRSSAGAHFRVRCKFRRSARRLGPLLQLGPVPRRSCVLLIQLSCRPPEHTFRRRPLRQLCPDDACVEALPTREHRLGGPTSCSAASPDNRRSMAQLSDKTALVTFRLVACWALLTASGCGCFSHSPAQDAHRAKADGSNSDSIVAPPTADTVDEHPRSRSLPGGPGPASSDAVAPAADPPLSSIPSLPNPGAGDTPVNSGAGDATPLQAPERARRPNDSPQ
jgi:hypothetical protein